MIHVETKVTGVLAKDAWKRIILNEHTNAMDLAVQVVEGNVAVTAKKKGLKGVTGHLISGIYGKRVTPVLGRIVMRGPASVYGEVMELGRRKGSRQPPSEALERWVFLKLREEKEKVKSTAYLIARSIKKKGIKGRNFFKIGERISKQPVENIFKSMKRRIEKRLSD